MLTNFAGKKVSKNVKKVKKIIFYTFFLGPSSSSTCFYLCNRHAPLPTSLFLGCHSVPWVQRPWHKWLLLGVIYIELAVDRGTQVYPCTPVVWFLCPSVSPWSVALLLRILWVSYWPPSVQLDPVQHMLNCSRVDTMYATRRWVSKCFRRWVQRNQNEETNTKWAIRVAGVQTHRF